MFKQLQHTSWPGDLMISLNIESLGISGREVTEVQGPSQTDKLDRWTGAWQVPCAVRFGAPIAAPACFKDTVSGSHGLLYLSVSGKSRRFWKHFRPVNELFCRRWRRCCRCLRALQYVLSGGSCVPEEAVHSSTPTQTAGNQLYSITCPLKGVCECIIWCIL